MRFWIKLISALLLIAVLLWLGWQLIAGLGAVLRNVDLNAGEPDPMFAEEAVLPTRPPELDEEQPQPSHATLDDYIPEIKTPVDRTAEELILEAQAAAKG